MVRHVCQRDAISLELAAVDDTNPLSPDFFDRHVVIAGVRWSVAAVDLIARHAKTAVLFPTLNGFESYDALKTVPPYREWTKDGYAITGIAPSDPQHVGRAMCAARWACLRRPRRGASSALKAPCRAS